MTSDRRRRANRINAKSSTGPKTVQGKARAGQNALRHGLNVPVINDVEHAPEIESLARRLADVDADAEVLELARKVSEAQVDINRVCAIRLRYIVNRFSLRPPLLNLDTDAIRQNPLEGDDKLAAILAEPEITTLDRYERRAISRRTFAIREFDQRCTLSE